MASNETAAEKSIDVNSKKKTGSKEKTDEKRFRWDKDEKVDNLIRCLGNYKAQMEYKNVDFNGDKVKQYEAVREAMARIYEHEPTFFGPPTIRALPTRGESDEEQIADIEKQQRNDRELIKKGYNRIQEKVIQIRQSFSIAVTTGSRSGSGKIVLEYFDQLKVIWGGSPSTEPLECGVSSNDVNGQDLECEPGAGECSPVGSDGSNVMYERRKSTSDDEEGITDSESTTSQRSASSIKATKTKKRAASNPVPKLIDNKRKHLERQLSASQRDQLLMNESREDTHFKKEITDAIKQSNETFAQSMHQMSESMKEMTKGLTQSFQFLTRAMFTSPAPHPPHYQYPMLPWGMDGNTGADRAMSQEPSPSYQDNALFGMSVDPASRQGYTQTSTPSEGHTWPGPSSVSGTARYGCESRDAGAINSNDTHLQSL